MNKYSFDITLKSGMRNCFSVNSEAISEDELLSRLVPCNDNDWIVISTTNSVVKIRYSEVALISVKKVL